MNVIIKIAHQLKRPFVTIQAPADTPGIQQLKRHIETFETPLLLNAYQDDHRLVKIPARTVTRFYTANKVVWCETADGRYRLRERLYELERQLPTDLFLRISSGEIVRIACIHKFTLTPTGTFQVQLTNGTTTFASRRYTQHLRKDGSK